MPDNYPSPVMLCIRFFEACSIADMEGYSSMHVSGGPLSTFIHECANMHK